MTVYKIPMEDGTTSTVNGPEGMPMEQAREIATKKWREDRHANGAWDTFQGGITFGFNDELSGLQSALVSMVGNAWQGKEQDPVGAYEKERDMVRLSKKILGEDHPIMAVALDLGGGILTGGGLLKAIQLGTQAYKGAKSGRGVLEFLNRNVVAQGAVEGALAGAGEAEGDTLGERAMNSAIGGVLGGAGGAAGGKVAEAVSGVVSKAGWQAKHADELLRGDRSPAEAAGELAEFNAVPGTPDNWAMWGDINPQAAQTAMQVSRPGEAAIIQQAFKDQRRQQAPLVEGAARTITDTPTTRQAELDLLTAERRAEAETTYGPLEGRPAAPTPELQATLNTEAGGRAAADALAYLNDARARAMQPPLDLDQAQQTFDFWHIYQRGLKDVAETGKVASSDISALMGESAGKSRRQVMDDLFTNQQWGDEYRNATDLYRERSQVIEALTDSAKFGNMDEGEVQAVWRSMATPEQQKAFQYGVINDMVKKAMRTGDEGDMTRHFTGNENLRRNLRMVLGDEVFERLDDAMQKLQTISEANREVLRGSPTEPRRARAEMLLEAKNRIGDLNNPMAWARWVLGGFQQSRTVSDAAAIPMREAVLAREPKTLLDALSALENTRNRRSGYPTLVGAQAGSKAGISLMPEEAPESPRYRIEDFY